SVYIISEWFGPGPEPRQSVAHLHPPETPPPTHTHTANTHHAVTLHPPSSCSYVLSVAGSETGREKEGTEGGQISSGGKQKGGGGEGAMEEVLFRSQPR
ncbi:Membrane protein insertase YidC, partial [Dissostichus eleginoides]